MNTRKLRILVDMDSTVAKFIDEVANQWNLKYPDFLAPSLEEITEFRLEKIYSKLHGQWAEKAVFDIYQGPNFYNNLPIYDGAVKALNEMVEEGHDVFFCSAPSSKYQHCVRDKYSWVDKHFGKDWIKRIILTSDKTFISADYIIDDKPKITGVQNPPLWKHIYYTQPHNSNLDGPRINNWSEWRDVIAKLEANNF